MTRFAALAFVSVGLASCATPECARSLCGGGTRGRAWAGAGGALPGEAGLRITAIDTGQGDCALVECPNGTNVMIDCGSSRRARSSVDHVRELLAARIGEAAIDVLVLTHADRDHYQWIPPVLEGRELSRVIHSAQLDAYDQAGTADWLRERVPASERYALPAAHHDPVEAPSRLIDCGEIEVHVLAANIAPGSAHASSDSWRSNTGSIVLRFGRHGVPRAIAILAGDATRDTERSIVTAYANAPDFVGADLLRLGHHGSSTTSNDVAWIDAVRPRVAFSSSGHYGGALRHPRCEVVQRVVDAGHLEDSAPHELRCGLGVRDEPPPGYDCEERWCGRSFAVAIFDTFSSGDLTFEVAPNGVITTSVAR